MFTTLILAALVAAPGPKPATNTTCPVLGGKVTPGKSPKVVVRGQEYLLCCAGCDTDLIKSPDKYLEKDGTPKNAKGK
jgi:YHS domain-containing protein